MSDCMTFPNTVEEFMEDYKVVDTDQVYSNGTEFVPIFRMKQWFEHLQDAPTVKPEPCEDAISRKEVLTLFAHNCDHVRPYTDTWKAVKQMTPVTPKQKKGKWKRHNTYHGDDISSFVDPDWRCSECGRQANVNAWCLYDLTNFCPNCGADMREGEQE